LIPEAVSVMRIAVFGTGGVGGYFGGRLAQAGETVTFIARGAHLATIRTHGLRVSSIAGDFTVQPAQATDQPGGVGEVDAVLVAVKAWQLSEAASAMRPLVGPETIVVPLQNGIEAPEHLREGLDRGRVLGGLCRIIAYLEAPGHIRHFGVEPVVEFGELDGRMNSQAEQLRDAFGRARGARAAIPPDICAAMWSKFLFITAVGAVGALSRAPIGVLRSEPRTRGLLIQALEEIQAVARGHRIGLPADIVRATLEVIDGLPPDGTVSMQRDISEGRPSELDAQVGAVVRLAETAGVAAPLHSLALGLLLPLERRARGELRFNA
jgi:2-dehydropantoate 2-reductase